MDLVQATGASNTGSLTLCRRDPPFTSYSRTGCQSVLELVIYTRKTILCTCIWYLGDLNLRVLLFSDAARMLRLCVKWPK